MGESFAAQPCAFPRYLLRWKFVKETIVCMATISIKIFGTQLLAKNFNVKESLITEEVGMQFPLRRMG